MPVSAAILARYPNPVLIESGTWHGDGVVAALLAGFSRVDSIELSPELHRRACSLFAADPRVQLYLGSSIDRLPDILANLGEPATFWLDAHDSGGDTVGDAAGCPLLGELALIAAHPIKHHTVLIDDLRLCGTDLPTWEDVLDAVRAINPAYRIELIESGAPGLGLDILAATC